MRLVSKGFNNFGNGRQTIRESDQYVMRWKDWYRNNFNQLAEVLADRYNVKLT